MSLRTGALILVCAVSIGGCSGSGRAKATTGPAATAARAFLDRYAGSDGRVRRTDQGDDTVSEGQAYGMLIAAGIGDAGRFDAIWGWTQANLRRPDGLLSFHWQGGRVVDPEAATDADLDAARALLVAGCRFGRPSLTSAGATLGRAILAHESTEVAGHLLLAAGPFGTRDPVIVNPSYLDPASLAALQDSTGDGRFGEAAAGARWLVGSLSHPLPPDWATVSRATAAPQPSGPPGQPATQPVFSFDAARTPLRFAQDPDPAGRRIAAAAWPVFRGQDPQGIVVEHNPDGSPAGATHHPLALVAAAGAATAAGDRRAAGKLLDAAAALDRRQPTYYGSAWVALGRLMLQTDDLRACPPSS